jgi:hypothetical protein
LVMLSNTFKADGIGAAKVAVALSQPG